jgi:hypothetical protein
MAFLIKGWGYYIQYSQQHESTSSVKHSGTIKKGYRTLQYFAGARLIMLGLIFLLYGIQWIFSFYIPLMDEIFTIIYMIFQSIIDIGVVIIGPMFILLGQIKLGRELMSYSSSLATEPVLSDASLYGQLQHQKFCKQCGASMLEEAQFCPHCGQST